MLRQMKKVLFPLFVSFSVLLASCASSSVGSYRKTPRINEGISRKQLASESYCFIRLYDVIYKSTFAPGNFIRRPIRIVGTADDGVAYVHSAMSTKLKDESFIGVSLTSESNMVQFESVNDPGENKYMNSLEYPKCRCIVLAVPCKDQDVENVNRLLDYVLSHDTIYGISRIIAAPFYHWGNLDNYSHSRNFPIEFAFDSIPLQKEPGDVFHTNNFVCSTLIAYILQNAVERYRVDYLINRQHFAGYTPVDLYYLDGCFELFECAFDEYDGVLEAFVSRYPEFKKYAE